MEELFTLSPAFLGAVPIVLGLVQGFKGLGLPSKFAFLVSIALGIGLVALTGATLPATVIGGLLVGLSASGLYSGVKSVVTEE